MYQWLLIWRYFRHKRVALMAVAAVGLLVMMVLVVLSVMSGLVEEARVRNHQWSGDVVIGRESLVGFDGYEEFLAELGGQEWVAAATPVIRTYGMIGARDAGAIYGVRLGEFCEVTGFGGTLHFQRGQARPSFVLPAVAELERAGRGLTAEQRRRGCMIGSEAAVRERIERLVQWDGRQIRGYWPWRLTVFGMNRRGLLTGSEAGESQTFWFVDDYITRLVDIDAALLVDFDQLQRLCLMDGTGDEPKRASEIRVRLGAGTGLKEGREKTARLWEEFVRRRGAQHDVKLLGDVSVQTWQEYRRSQIAPLEKEKTIMVLVFGMIGVVAVFMVFAIFYMIVTEKIKDLGILKSVGGSGWGVSAIFLGYGALVGLVGAVLGSGLGWLIVVNSNAIEGWLNARFGFRLWPPDVYPIDKIPDVVNGVQAAMIAAAAVAAAVAGAVLPAWRAARLEVVETLRVE